VIFFSIERDGWYREEFRKDGENEEGDRFPGDLRRSTCLAERQSGSHVHKGR